MTLFLLLINQPLTQHYYRLAIVNPYSFVLQLLVVVTMVSSFRHFSKQASRTQVGLKGCLTGVLLAMATSVKLDGAFLLLAPVVIGLWWQAQFFLTKKQLVRAEAERNIRCWVWWMVGFLLAGLVTFTILEPELWSNSVNGVLQLFASRLTQQERFSFHFADLSWHERLVFLADQSGNSSKKFSWLIRLILGFGIGVWLAHFINNWSKKFDHTQMILLVTLLAVLFGSLYCFRVGFDRYLIPALVVLYTVACLGYSVLLTPLLKENYENNRPQ